MRRIFNPKKPIFYADKSDGRFNWRRLPSAIFVLALVGLGVYSLGKSIAGTPPAVAACGARVTDYSYNRPYGSNAPWNIPVCGISTHSQSEQWRDRLWNYGRAQNWSADPNADKDKSHFNSMFGLEKDPQSDFSIPVYSATTATTRRGVWLKSNALGGTNIPTMNVEVPETIPWNPDWIASGGSDHNMVILDPANGREYNIWGYVNQATNGDASYNSCVTPLGVPASRTRHWYVNGYFPNDPGRGGDKSAVEWFDPSRHICVYAAQIVHQADDSFADYHSYEGNSPNSKGSGLPGYSMLVEPQEVQAGEIRHALSLAINSTMFGRECRDDEINTSSFGFSCGSAVAPAGLFENKAILDGRGRWGLPIAPGNSPDEMRSRTTPEGMRFALNIDDTYIEQWLDSRDYNGTKRNTARIFAQALRDYGFFVADSSSSEAAFQLAGASNKTTAAAWRSLGIDGDGHDLLHGLIQQERLYTLEPPDNNCANGQRSKFYCHASTSNYAVSSAPVTRPAVKANRAPSSTFNFDTKANTLGSLQFTPYTGFRIYTTASDPDGTIVRTQLFRNNQEISGTPAAPSCGVGCYQVESMSDPDATYVYTIIVTDNQNFKTRSAPLLVYTGYSRKPAPAYPAEPTNPAVDYSGTSPTTSPSANQSPNVAISAPVNGQNVAGNTLIAAVNADDDNGIAQVEYFNGNTSIGKSGTGNTYYVVANNLAPGNYTLTAVATDSSGLKTTSAPVTYTMLGNGSSPSPNRAPVVGLNASALNLSAGSNLSLDASVSDPENNKISKVEFYEGDRLLSIMASPPYTYVISSIPSGSHTYTAKAFDAGSPQGVGVSNPVSVTVVDSAPASQVSPPASLAASLNFNIFRWHYGIDLRWSAATANNGVKEYIIRRSDNNGVPKEVGRSLSTEYQDYNIAADQAYRYDVLTLDTNNLISAPRSISATTQCSVWIIPVCTLK